MQLVHDLREVIAAWAAWRRVKCSGSRSDMSIALREGYDEK
jgi:hypothetical protein